ncbi:MAG: glycoside hydrolase family 38 N-terminal domain-containing protein [Pirellulaceae bacterium]
MRKVVAMKIRWTLALLIATSHCMLTAAALRSMGAESIPDEVAFCHEVLILHHSHVDIGYTHPQSMYWELQKDYLNAALDMLDRTEDWPDDLSRPRWTVEVTAPLVRWLQTAPARDVGRLKKHIASGRLGISGFEYNLTPLSSSEGLARQLYHVRALREQLGADIRTVHQHDVTGLPWGAVDLLLDSQIECLVMGINLHLSGTPMPRPAVYRWRGPSGRELLVMNGEHYSMFDQWCDPSSRNLETVQTGIYKYLRHLHSLAYPYDFVYLTATHAPYMYDNSPPNQDLPDVVRQWNEEGRHPRLRLVTPNELLARIQQIPRQQIPVVTGDWTDYWNFGAGSSAAETCLVRKLAANTAAIDLLRTVNPPDSHTAAAIDRLWDNLNLYNEHTWGAHNTLDADNPFVVTQWHLKAHSAYDGKPLSDYHLRRELHRLVGNPWQSWQTGGVLVVNPTGVRQTYYVPGTWQGGGKRVESHYMGVEREATARPLDQLYGPVPLEPFSWQIIPWSELAAAPASNAIQIGADSIETDHYKLTFDPACGKITGLLDKSAARQVVAPDSSWGFFQLVHERPALQQRSAFHVRSVEGERYGRTGWQRDWEATRTSYSNAVTCTVEQRTRSATLVIQGAAEGVSDLEQRITLHADSPIVDLSARFLKADIRSPEALYFAFPLNLPAHWRAHFDTAGTVTELDAEQIPGSCRDWVTVETFASVHQPDFGVTLYCPDAPLVQIGNFNFAKKQDVIPRETSPLLLAWPMNNYWETNFRASQPGIVHFRYSFTSHGPFDPSRAVREGQQACNPPVTHLVLDDATPRQGRFLDVRGTDVVGTYVKPANDGSGVVARLVNLGNTPTTATLTLPGQRLADAWLCGTLEDNRARLPLVDHAATCELQPRQLTTIRLVRQHTGDLPY